MIRFRECPKCRQVEIDDSGAHAAWIIRERVKTSRLISSDREARTFLESVARQAEAALKGECAHCVMQAAEFREAA